MRWDPTEVSNGGAERVAREALLEMEMCNCNVEEMDQEAVTNVVDFAKASENVQLKVLGYLGDTLRLPAPNS